MFRRYLRHLVEAADITLVLKYFPSGGFDPHELMMLSEAASTRVARSKEVEFGVLTLAFYARFVCYALDLELFVLEQSVR